MMALLHSNGQLRTERDGDTEKGCQKPALQQKTTDAERTDARSPSRVKCHISNEFYETG